MTGTEPVDGFDDELDDDLDDDLDDEGTYEADRRPRRSGGLSLDPDALLDQLVPPSVDWKGTVRRHPVMSMAAVGMLGFVVGRTKGAAIVAGLTTGLSSALMRQLSDVFEGDFFDF